MFELTKTKPWTDGGSRLVMEEAPKRLARQGWDDVRPALSLTVRYGIAPLSGVLRPHHLICCAQSLDHASLPSG